MPEKTAPVCAPDFEAAMSRLEQIVGQMESGQMPLNDLIQQYEEGTRLIQFCQESLQSAEKRIETVTRKLADPSPIPPATISSHPPESDVSLF